ncbi:hypothetical protein PUNSTDRAFT_54108 [Punctularia strigosozonata HHB-11173 SS5]|uniref:uncharacterized protein n=1 Tax=Punctularia strigosozonata (strain HHB-11173) TaxID=741275 RepID=UPI00044173AB|nr:uncharacterized protein PUNSTDRAFT_54108 [Punctularia strigosozonata HHB-11173 SS5]EIN06711.1 hypothetical protein PUNSTDRAFT_54108 [Punctularia strigosozonata HHB-11173 SS5]
MSSKTVLPVLPANSPSNEQTPDLLTFRYQATRELTYVATPISYPHALRTAYDAFPSSLTNVPPARITLHLQAFVGPSATPSSIRIFPNAWEALVRTLHRFEIIDVVVAPLPEDKPPAYPEQRDVDAKSSPSITKDSDSKMQPNSTSG